MHKGPSVVGKQFQQIGRRVPVGSSRAGLHPEFLFRSLTTASDYENTSDDKFLAIALQPIDKPA